MTFDSAYPLHQPLQEALPPRRIKLTYREIDVLRELLNDGPENKTIGKRLYLTEDTVKTHMRRILGKANSTNRTAVVIDILRHRVLVFDARSRVVKF